ncbi:MAG: sodium:alanine symporter family protein [Chlamydiales bacterium]|nr:sodium:alanine symporter family protein [Chlamydiales bacterium]
MSLLSQWLLRIDGWVWGPALLIFLVGTGVYLTFLLRGLQFCYLGYALKLAFSRHNKEGAGDISHFQSLMTSLAATIGIGNIAGVATAIMIGGAGALFWMWITALVGMATKYSEAILAVKYRIVDKRGEMAGGPMYFIERGFGCKWLAILFALFGAVAALGTGNMVQSHSVADAVQTLLPVNHWWIGISLGILTACVLFGGVKSIGKVSSVLVPVMALLYLLGGLAILVISYDKLPKAFVLIVESAFTGQAAVGGFVGSSLLLAIQMGVARGVFSNEAGLGTASIAAAAAKTDVPGRQALISMTGTFLATLVVCTITGLVITTTGVIGSVGQSGELLNGGPLTMRAFDSVLPGGGLIVTIGVVLFAYSTIIGWAYYGEKCIEYLFGERSINLYRLLFTLFVVLGSGLSLDVVWSLADISNGLMAIPNLIGVLGLSHVVASETRAFERLLKTENSRF